MLTKYGTNNIIWMMSSGLIIIALAIIIYNPWASIPLGIIGLLLILFTFWFFRDPNRKIPEETINDHSVILSPADGKIVEIVKEKEDIYLKTDTVRISIFLSPLDIHVNRSPAYGIVKYFKYHPGKYLAAYKPKSSLANEQTHIGMENQCGKIFFKQIVGILARRLVWDIKEGSELKSGQRFGMMKFGSRMDVALPLDSEIFVKTGNKVKAGLTKLAKLPCK
jgi:phosphatidylserine decarboxylase